MFLIISRILNDDIKQRLQSLLNAGIDAYLIIDKELDKSTKRVIRYDNELMEKEGYLCANVQAPSQKEVYRITGWDKALYHAFKSNKKYVWFCEDDIYWNRPAVVKAIVDKTESMKDDLICTELAPSINETPKWFHWSKCQQITSNKQKWMGTFNQLSRLSDRLLKKVDDYAKSHGNLLLHEALFATLAKLNNFKISYLTDLKLPIYIKIRWNPEFSAKDIEELLEENSYILLHPVKSDEARKAYSKEVKKDKN
jgi:hypothetical protein